MASSDAGKASPAQLNIPAEKPPPGLSESELNSSYSGIAMTVVLTLFALFAVTFFAIRIYAKTRLVRRLWWDDLTCLLGLLGGLLDLVCFAIGSIAGPLGEHMWNITIADEIGPNNAVTSYILQVIGGATLGFVKLTIFLFYLDLFWPLTWVRWCVYIGGSLTTAFYLSVTVCQFYYITPRPGETIAQHFLSPMAAKVETLSIPTSSVGLVIDIFLLIIPLVAVVQMKLAKKKKIRLILTFMVGIMAVVGSILSLTFKVKTYHYPDLTYHLILVEFFINCEQPLGIVLSCMPLVARVGSYHRASIISFLQNISASLRAIEETIVGRTIISRKRSALSDEKDRSWKANPEGQNQERRMPGSLQHLTTEERAEQHEFYSEGLTSGEYEAGEAERKTFSVAMTLPVHSDDPRVHHTV